MTEKQEVIRYLGGKGLALTEEMQALIDTCMREVEAAAEPKSVMRRFSLGLEADVISAGGLSMTSKSLARNLKDCEEVVFFAATLGSGVDRLLQKYLKLQVSKAVVVQAAAAAAIEAYCNQCQKKLEEAVAAEGLFVRPRYSPGYGDLPLTVQRSFLDVLQAGKTTGIVLTDGDIMLPEKSVTAIMGLSCFRTDCHASGCEVCDRQNCAYRRGK